MRDCCTRNLDKAKQCIAWGVFTHPNQIVHEAKLTLQQFRQAQIQERELMILKYHKHRRFYGSHPLMDDLNSTGMWRWKQKQKNGFQSIS